MTKDATSDCVDLRNSASCHIWRRTLEYVSLERVFALLSLTSLTLCISRTTFSEVSLAWKSQRSEPQVNIYIHNPERSGIRNPSLTFQMVKLIYTTRPPTSRQDLHIFAGLLAVIIADVNDIWEPGVVGVHGDKLRIACFH